MKGITSIGNLGHAGIFNIKIMDTQTINRYNRSYVFRLEDGRRGIINSTSIYLDLDYCYVVELEPEEYKTGQYFKDAFQTNVTICGLMKSLKRCGIKNDSYEERL